ncbi:MAG TPA: molybdopterin-binding protein [Acidimicrobiia bacterium]
MAERILIADDDDDVLDAIRINLEVEGYEIHLAHDGNEVLQQARALTPDLILLDVVMPGPDGVDVCRELKADARTRDALVVFLTGRGATRDEAIGLIAGADDYIVKPFDPTDLIARVKRVLATRHTTPPRAEVAGLHARVLTVSDGVAAGTRDDQSGRALVDRLTGAGFEVDEHRVSGDGVEPVATALRDVATGFAGLVVTTGGTGFGPRDLTPEATRSVIDREAPGLAEAMRAASNAPGRPFGMLSRGVCGTVGSALVCNLPGSAAGALDCLDVILPSIPHALELLAGKHVH